ncbi:MAG: hypothetical protein SVG88_10620 [Halobacteriales archaeon]|nr:hypothetical protein [Halobacteriales archaeon]
MAAKPRHKNSDNIEQCEACDSSTPHDVRIEILTESHKRENAEFSREPYRIAECLECGSKSKVRMNNA